jgi:hypothetical protein
MAAEGTKVCQCCGRLLSTSMFHRHRTSKDGFWNTCKECCREERNALKEKQRNRTSSESKATFKIEELADSMIFAELKRRGYVGELKFSKTVII